MYCWVCELVSGKWDGGLGILRSEMGDSGLGNGGLELRLGDGGEGGEGERGEEGMVHFSG